MSSFIALLQSKKQLSDEAFSRFSKDEWLTLFIAICVLVCTANSLLMPEVHRELVRVRPLSDMLICDLIAFFCVPPLIYSIILERRGENMVRQIRPALLLFLCYNDSFYLFAQPRVAWFISLLYLVIFVLGFYTTYLSLREIN